jgi:HD superfamily phosphohydrolase
MDGAEIRRDLREAGPALTAAIDAVVRAAIEPALKNVGCGKARATNFPKIVNDPVWGTIELLPWEVVLLDAPLLQRLRGIRQLGMAHLVYPSAGHDRLQHSCGVVEAAQRIISSLTHNAQNRRRFGRDRDVSVPEPSELDIVAARLGALLHDVGHSPFSHATEPVVRERFEAEFGGIENVLRATFEGVTGIATSETVAVLMVFSEPMQCLFEHPQFEACKERAALGPAIAARLLGSRSWLQATYLSGVISGPLDADKIDYMARDSHHAGLPLGLDITRLISKLEVVAITPDTAPNPDLRNRAREDPKSRIYDVGISLAGLGAYEQMVISRVILYDRLYYHHKVRAAEAMVRELIHVAEQERAQPYDLAAFYGPITDDETVDCLAGNVTNERLGAGSEKAKALGAAIRERRIYYRAYAFSSRFIAGLDSLSEKHADDTRGLRWSSVARALADPEQRRSLARDIREKAVAVGKELPEFKDAVTELREEHVIVDLPSDKLVVRGGDILTRTESGEIGTPNLFFDPEKWSEAYAHQKQCGYVFCPESAVALVALASSLAFYERFTLVMGAEARRSAKTTRHDFAAAIRMLAAAGLCSAECAELLTSSRPQLALIDKDDLKLPEAITRIDPGLAERLAKEFRAALPGGMPAEIYRVTASSIAQILTVLLALEEGGRFTNRELKEKELQEALRDHLRTLGVPVTEGGEVGGGETDLVLYGMLVVENKVRGKTANPCDEKYDFQAGRYRMAICSSVGFVVVAYTPADEQAVLPVSKRIRVTRPARRDEDAAVIWISIPYGHPVPSEVRKPSAVTVEG